MERIVIVGAGQAGSALAAKLRACGYGGALTLVGSEHVPPYQRPPLSKKYLMGEMELERLFLRPAAFYSEQDIELRLDATVDAIDRSDKVVIQDGAALPYDALALTTGAVPRRLPAAIGATLGGVHVVRTIRDVDRMRGDFRSGARALIVGGGYIGLEAAAVAAHLGLDVTLVETADRILQRVAAPETADYFRALHAAHGVTIREGTGLARLEGAERVERAILDDGSVLDVDLVVVGVGITPATELAEAAGLAVENGIRVDTAGQTSDPAIWAAGDCASFPRNGRRIRLESVQNAIDQAEIVAENMLGAGKVYDPVPWFWSDQYDAKLQIAGLNTGYDRVVVRQGADPSVRAHWYLADGQLCAVDAMNDPRAYMVGKRLLENGLSPDPEQLADPSVNLKTLLR